MSHTIELNYSAAPSFGTIYKGILLRRRKGYRAGQPWPAMRSTWRGARVDTAKLAAYRGLTNWPTDGTLPLLYPHIISSPIHLGMMAHPDFLLSPLGGVHARNVILQHRPISESESLDIVCELGTPRVLKQGCEFDISTLVTVGGATVWESTSSYLFRGKYGQPQEGYEPPRLPDLGTVARTGQWRVPPDMGRRYAKACGDYNPIHVSKILAKLFGFKRDLIHGMWSAARSLVEAGAAGAPCPRRFDVIFKGPIWIGAGTEMRLQQDGDTVRYDLFCSGNDRPCINAQLRPAQPGETLLG